MKLVYFIALVVVLVPLRVDANQDKLINAGFCESTFMKNEPQVPLNFQIRRDSFNLCSDLESMIVNGDSIDVSQLVVELNSIAVYSANWVKDSFTVDLIMGNDLQQAILPSILVDGEALRVGDRGEFKLQDSEVEVQITDVTSDVSGDGDDANLGPGTTLTVVYRAGEGTGMYACQVDCYAFVRYSSDMLNLALSPLREKQKLLQEQHHAQKRKEWERYIEHSRGEWPWETLANYHWIYKGSERDKENRAPRTQLILMRPSVWIENLGSAEDGEQLGASVGFEVLGVNYWEGTKWCMGKPCGASLVASYNDRASADDFGFGVVFSIDNKYQVGTINYGGDWSIVFSVDLLNLKKSVEETKARYGL
ncbi:hypothetical protein [Ferrimonas marina]|uniref:Uncharacterized protein n=1 Tax=Ferrimonas marina TaxID=299255 RepID=A0A1M5T5D5_9GAMM|nr:hypothetical protein [Ferrimonas marina]SHH45981.1 hypothetical protein SAMN02745129_2009 [Ferrimonas marina]